MGRRHVRSQLLGNVFVDYIAADMHEGVVETVIDPFLGHGTETGEVMENKAGLDCSGVR